MVRMISIKTDAQDAYIFLNTKKPWWKTKGKIWYIPSNHNWMIDLGNNKIDLEKLFIKFNGEDKLNRLKDYCNYI